MDNAIRLVVYTQVAFISAGAVGLIGLCAVELYKLAAGKEA